LRVIPRGLEAYGAEANFPQKSRDDHIKLVSSCVQVVEKEDELQATRELVKAVEGYAHIISTADAVYAEAPVENCVAFFQTARETSFC
jgi:hypothetical protein